MKLIVISKASEKLKNYINTTSTMQVVAAFDSLSGSLDIFRTQLLRVDKLVFVYSSEMEIRQEIIAFEQLFTSSGSLFRVQEVVYIYRIDSDVVNNDHIELVKVAIESIKETATRIKSIIVPDLRIVGVPDDLGYDSIREAIIGSSEKTVKLASSIGVYVRDKGGDDKLAFVSNPQDDSTIHPFNFGRINMYNSLNQQLVIRESPSPINEVPQKIPEYPEIDIPYYSQPNLLIPKFFVFSGLPCSGTTTVCTAMLSSALVRDRKIFALDISTTGDLVINLDVANIPYRLLTDYELLSYKAFEDFPDDNLLVYRCSRKDLKYHTIFFIINRLNIFLRDFLFVDCDLYELNTVLESLNSSMCYCCISTHMFETDIKKVQAVDFKDSLGFVMLNNTQTSPERKLPMLITEIRKLIPSDVRIAPPVFYDSFELEPELFESVLAVGR